MNRKLLFFINPVSGTKNKRKLEAVINQKCINNNVEFAIAYTNAKGNYQLEEHKIQDEAFTDIIIIGGDGTVNQLTNALRHLHLPFGIIPMGSGNGLARAANIPTSILKALTTIFKGNAIEVDAFMVNNHYSCMLSGVGFDAQVAHDFAQKSSRGLLTYTQQSIINYFKAHPYFFQINLPDFSFFTDAFFISIANSNQFGNNFTIAPEASLSDGLLDIVVVQKMHKSKLPFAILKQMKGNNKMKEAVHNVSKNNILYFQTPSIVIHNTKLAKLHIDGEPVATEEIINATIIPKAFKLIVP